MPRAIPDCSYKGGLPGFVQVVDDVTLAFPSYDGNGQFRSLGNLTVNPHVGMLFIDFEATKRIRVNGVASIDDCRIRCAPLIPAPIWSCAFVREEIFPNCPRYIHKMQMTELSAYAPRPNYEPPTPAWKQMEAFRDHLPVEPVEAIARF